MYGTLRRRGTDWGLFGEEVRDSKARVSHGVVDH